MRTLDRIILYIEIIGYWTLPAKAMILIQYRIRIGDKLDLTNPKKFNEKMQWLKLYWRDPLLTICADKWTVRSFVKDRIGEDYLIDIIGIFDKTSEIDLNKLPDKFILKSTHGSHWNIIVNEKGKEDWKKISNQLRRWLKKNYSYYGHEWVYKNIIPRIICEKLLLDEYGNLPMDYKIFCFNGNPRFIQVDIDRHTNHRRNIYDTSWNLLPFEIYYPMAPDAILGKPKHLEEILGISRRLSVGFCFVRVDLYYVQEKIYFGEMTFIHASGYERFRPQEYDRFFGDHIILPHS